MTRAVRTLLLCWAFALITHVPAPCFAGGTARGPYFGQAPPGSTATVFAPGILSLDDRYEYSIVFSADLSECVFGVTDSSWATFTLLQTRMSPDGEWSDPVTAPFLGDGDGLSPAYAPDGGSIYFASSRPAYPPANLWRSRRDRRGGWTAPEKVPAPVSSAADEWAPSFTDTGVMYFVSLREGGIGDADIYRATPAGDGYHVDHVPAPVSSEQLDSTPFIAPDGSYIIFESNRPGGFGQSDLYVSRRGRGGWSAPRNLGPGINTEQIEDEPYVTPDGKYLFFNRRAAWVTPRQTDLYWVDLEAVIGGVAGK